MWASICNPAPAPTNVSGPKVFYLIFSQNICLVLFLGLLTILLNISQPNDKYLWNFCNI